NNILEAAGLLHAGHLEAMSLEPTHAVRDRVNPSVKMRAVTRETFVQWANCEWSAFEYGEGEPSAEYLALVKAFSSDESMSMYIAEIDGHDAGAFLVTDEVELMGVYYFATKPEFRRKGVAASMTSEICRLSGGRKIVLQATPSGVPFYRAFGFEDLGAIEVYSTRADIF
ncbi:MAG: GNAT family N-acetyltransferase, partial [Synergistaceae bacterium]|nr:GNAT family N-acetyltransferase [Synergistaceae bacterium]